MREIVEKVVRLLAEEELAFARLQKLLRSQREAFLAARSAPLEKATEELAAAARKQEPQRARLTEAVADLARSVGIDPSCANFSQLAERLPGAEAVRVRSAAAAARRAAEAASVELGVGERLLGFAADFSESMLRSLLTAASATPSLYGRSGRTDDEVKRPRLSVIDATC